MAFIRWNENTQIWEKAVTPGSPTTLFNHLPIATPTLPGDTVNKAYVDSLVGGGGFVPYIGANQAVQLGSQSLFVGGASTISGELDLTGGTGTVYNSAPLEIRTVNTPRVSFHWPGVVASQIGMDNTGTIRTFNNPGTGYENFAAQNIVANGIIQSVGVIYPGRVDTGVIQSTWYLASHGSYGLYANTGMFFTQPILGNVYGLMDPNYLTRETTPTSFTPAPGGGTFTISTLYGAFYMRHNGFLFINFMMDCNFPGTLAYMYFPLPGGFVAQGYHDAPGVSFTGGLQGVRFEISPGDSNLYMYSNNSTALEGTGRRVSGNLMIYVG